MNRLPISNLKKNISKLQKNKLSLHQLGPHPWCKWISSPSRSTIQITKRPAQLDFVPELMDLTGESEVVKKSYGMDSVQNTRTFGMQYLLARRLVQRGVRFVDSLPGGNGDRWDQHGGLVDGHGRIVNLLISPSGVIRDLRKLGMLDDTLVVWTGEFGRTPLLRVQTAEITIALVSPLGCRRRDQAGCNRWSR